MEPNIVAIMVVVTVVIAVISFVFYWLFNEIAKKTEKVIEEETIIYVNPLPETIQSTQMPRVKPTPIRFNNESRVSRTSQPVSNRTSAVISRPAQTSTRQNERYDDWAYANNTTNVTEVLDK